MKQIKNVGTAILNEWVHIAGKIDAIPAHTFYSFGLTVLFFLLTRPIWNKMLDYHWSITLILAGLFMALWSTTSWMVLRIAREERETQRKRVVVDWLFTLFFVGMSMAIVNSQRTIIDPLDDGLDALVAVILGIVAMTIPLFVIANLAVSKSKSNGNPTT